MSADVCIGNAAGCRVYSLHAQTAPGQHHAVNYLRLTLVGALEAMLSVVSWVPAPAGRLRGRLCSGRGCEANLFGARVTPERKARPKQDCPDVSLGKTAALCLSSVQPCRLDSVGMGCTRPACGLHHKTYTGGLTASVSRGISRGISEWRKRKLYVDK